MKIILDLFQDNDVLTITKLLLAGVVTGTAGEGLEFIATADIYLSILLKFVSILAFSAGFVLSCVKVYQALKKK